MTVGTWVEFQGNARGILTKQVAFLQDFLRVLQVPLSVIIPAVLLIHPSINWGWYSRSISGHNSSVQKEDDGILMYMPWNLMMDPLRHKICNFRVYL
jgi:hypothetical protein